VCYDYGTGVDRDQTEAVKWYRLAAAQGNAQAQLNVGVCYAEGKDHTEAAKWYRLAAAQGHARALYNLAASYESGNGVPKDLAEASRLYELAANQEHEGAKAALKRLQDRSTLNSLVM
jgi:TPR repeat protein